MLCPSVCLSVRLPNRNPLHSQGPAPQSQSQSQSQTPVGVAVVAVCARSYVDVQTFAKCQTKDQRHNRGSNNNNSNNRRRHGKSNSNNNNNRMFGGAINEIPAFDRAEAQSGSQRGSQTKCKESKSYMYVHAIHICIQMPCRHTYIHTYTHVAPTDKAINY